ncbi:MAG TPA: hypothetical protein VJ576_02940 [Rhodocyclaceae bacterium]|nr:hypothetical protein [Rhodocyclaceae bacterium]
MKKIIMAVSLVAAAGAAFAGTTMTNGTAVTGGSSGACTLINTDVTPRLSNNVKGGYDCNTTTGYIGIGVASTAGQNKQFGLANKGGAIETATCASVAANAQTCANAAATTASNT